MTEPNVLWEYIENRPGGRESRDYMLDPISHLEYEEQQKEERLSQIERALGHNESVAFLLDLIRSYTKRTTDTPTKKCGCNTKCCGSCQQSGETTDNGYTPEPTKEYNESVINSEEYNEKGIVEETEECVHDEQRLTEDGLLDETLKVLVANKKQPSDVLWVGQAVESVYDFEDTKVFSISWDEFADIANKEYDSGYGGTEVNELLIVVGPDWWLERHEYDGSEWWEYKTMPIKPDGGKGVIFTK